jgi:hypothetical protein
MMTAIDKWLRYYHPLLRGRFGFFLSADQPKREAWHQGLGVTGGRFWVRIHGGHDLRRRAIDPVTGDDAAGASAGAVSDDPSDVSSFGALVGRSDGPNAAVTTFPWVGHAAGAAYRYALTVMGAGGVSDGADAPTAIAAFDATGAWTGPTPNPVGGLAVAPEAGGTFSLTWTYDEAGQAAPPELFEIYNDTGSPGSVDFDSVVATVPYSWRQGSFQWTSGPFTHDARVYWAVRAASSSGAAGLSSAVAFGVASAALLPAPDDVRVSRGRMC